MIKNLFYYLLNFAKTLRKTITFTFLIRIYLKFSFVLAIAFFLLGIFFYTSYFFATIHYVIIEAELVRLIALCFVFDIEYLIIFLLFLWGFFFAFESEHFGTTIHLMRKIRAKSKKWESFEVAIIELNQSDYFNYEEAEEGFFSYDAHPQTFKSRRTSLYEESLKTRLISDEVGNTYVNMSLLLHSKNQRFKRYWYVDYSFSDMNTALNSVTQESSSLYQPFSSYISIHRFGGMPLTQNLRK